MVHRHTGPVQAVRIRNMNMRMMRSIASFAGQALMVHALIVRLRSTNTAAEPTSVFTVGQRQPVLAPVARMASMKNSRFGFDIVRSSLTL